LNEFVFSIFNLIPLFSFQIATGVKRVDEVKRTKKKLLERASFSFIRQTSEVQQSYLTKKKSDICQLIKEEKLNIFWRKKSFSFH